MPLPAWVAVVVGLIKMVKPRIRRRIKLKAEPIVDAIVELEETYGDDQLWSTIHEARMNGTGATLSAQQIAQLDDFKLKVFNGTIREPLGKITEHVKDERTQAILEAFFDEED